MLVAVLFVAMVAAMLWQIDRLQQRQDLNTRIEARTELPVVDVETVLPIDETADTAATDDLEYRLVAATGVVQRADEVLVRNRPLNGAPGTWVLSPLLLDDGRAVIVNRGWIPNVYKPGDDRTEVDAPSGPLTVTGYLRTTETAQGLQANDPTDGVLTSLARPDLGRYGRMVDYDLLPMWLQAVSVEPADGTTLDEASLPVALDLPELSQGPHRSYAFQWGVYSLIALFGYPLILRRVARGRSVG